MKLFNYFGLLLSVLGLSLSVWAKTVIAEPALQLPKASSDFVLTQTPDASMGSHDQDVGIKKGSKVADFSVSTHDGKKADFSTLLKSAPLMVVFYRGGWCPYCNLQIRELTKEWPKFKRRGVTPVLISADSIDGAALASTTYKIPFPVLSDTNLTAHNAFDVTLDVDAETYKLYQSYGIELEAWSGKGHHKIAVSSAFLVDSEGIVQWAHTSKDYQTRPTAKQLLSVIDAIALD
ncbi:alkyl hydroperoxide reductase [Gammaproteobacteria bacterium 42_54_T18]|nr:alkyl hydroperoxide reductase [Gammaproteobacteria bacterium 42_54_T18]